MTYVVVIGQGIGNMVQATAFMNWVRDRGHQVLVRRKRVFSAEAVNLIGCAFDGELKGAQTPPRGSVEKPDIFKHFGSVVKAGPEWAAYFKYYGFDVPPAAQVRTSVRVGRSEAYYPVVLAPCSRWNWPMKKYPYWQALIDRLPGCAVVGLPPDGGELHGNFTDLRGRLSLAQVAAVLKSADICIAEEGGIGHVSCATGTKTVILFGGTDLNKNLPPNNAIPLLAEGDFPCRPCQYRMRVNFHTRERGNTVWYGCKPEQRVNGTHARCMAGIPPARIVETVEKEMGW